MPGPEHTEELQSLKAQIEDLRDQLGRVEARAEAAEQEAHTAREEVMGLRDQVAAAERDQQDLRGHPTEPAQIHSKRTKPERQAAARAAKAAGRLRSARKPSGSNLLSAVQR
jgi:predicted  nucleic acid-binding Zn-ribbon protein